MVRRRIRLNQEVATRHIATHLSHHPISQRLEARDRDYAGPFFSYLPQYPIPSNFIYCLFLSFISKEVPWSILLLSLTSAH